MLILLSFLGNYRLYFCDFFVKLRSIHSKSPPLFGIFFGLNKGGRGGGGGGGRAVRVFRFYKGKNKKKKILNYTDLGKLHLKKGGEF